MISLEDWALIRHLHHSEKLSQRAIAKQLGVARKTVAAALASDGPPRYERAPAESAISAAEPRIRALLSVYPQMPATVIAERVGWSGSMSWFRERVAAIRPEYAPADPADRLEHRPGRVVQCDLWFPPAKIPLGFGQVGCPPVLVMVAAFSRFITAVMLPSRQAMDLVAGMWLLLSGQLGAVPHELWWDNEAAIGRRGRLTDPVTGFVGTLATKLVQLKPYDPESKGIVERANRYLETSFLTGRTFTSPSDFNEQLTQWLPIANGRTVRRIGGRPIDLVGPDTAAMLPLPPLSPTVENDNRGAVESRLLRAGGRQRLLGAPVRDRTARRRAYRAVGHHRRPPRSSAGHPRTSVDERQDDHRPRPRRGRGSATQPVPAASAGNRRASSA